MHVLDDTPGALLRETHEHIQAELGDAVQQITLERIVIGLFFTGVKLSNGVGGICFTPVKNHSRSRLLPQFSQSDAEFRPPERSVGGRFNGGHVQR